MLFKYLYDFTLQFPQSGFMNINLISSFESDLKFIVKHPPTHPPAKTAEVYKLFIYLTTDIW